MTKAQEIYDDAVSRAWRDHSDMIDKFWSGEIDMASPCGIDRERQYIIEAFDAALTSAYREGE